MPSKTYLLDSELYYFLTRDILAQRKAINQLFCNLTWIGFMGTKKSKDFFFFLFGYFFFTFKVW